MQSTVDSTIQLLGGMRWVPQRNIVLQLNLIDIINPEFCAPTSQIHKVDHTETHQTIQSVNIMCSYILLSCLEVVVTIICSRQSSTFGSFCAFSSLLNNSKIFTEARLFFLLLTSISETVISSTI